MARATRELIEALRIASDRLESGARYQWSHMGECNCGHIAQVVTKLSKEDIHRAALDARMGDWAEQAQEYSKVEYCNVTGQRMGEVLMQLEKIGLTAGDIAHLERLDDQQVLRRFPIGQRHFKRNRRADVVAYMRAFADLLHERYIAEHGEAADGLEALAELEEWQGRAGETADDNSSGVSWTSGGVGSGSTCAPRDPADLLAAMSAGRA